METNGSLLVVDTGNNVIRELSPQGTNWVVTTIAGAAGLTGASDGTNADARFNQPLGIAVDAANNAYVSDAGNYAVRQLTRQGTNWTVSTIYVSPWTPTLAGIAVDGGTNLWVVSAYYNNFSNPYCVVTHFRHSDSGWVTGIFDWYGYLTFYLGVTLPPGEGPYFVDRLENGVVKMDGSVSVAGSGSAGFVDGLGSEARFSSPQGLAADPSGALYVADTGNNAIRKVVRCGANASGSTDYCVATIGGSALGIGTSDGTDSVLFGAPTSLAVDGNGNVYVSDTGAHTIWAGHSPLCSMHVVATPGDPEVQAAHFQIDGGSWAPVGSTVRLLPGEHTLVFEKLSGWLAPSNQTFTATSNGVLTGAYLEQKATLCVNLEPAALSEVGQALWRLDDEDWQWTGTTLSGVPFGEHQLGFTWAPGWVGPTNFDLLITTKTNVLSFTFTPMVPEVPKSPSISITSPVWGQIWTNPVFVMNGVATNNDGVIYVVNNIGWVSADGTSNWRTAPLTLVPGPATGEAYAVTSGGLASRLATVRFIYAPTAPLRLTLAGAGTVSPNLDGRFLKIGREHTLTARPAPGSVFAGWSGASSEASPTLTFVMQTNTALQANFEPSPFIPLEGTYQGLFCDTNSVTQASSGFLSLRLLSSGAFSASALVQGRSCGFSGRFWVDGSSSNYVTRPVNPISLRLQLDLSGATGLTGELTTPQWKARLTAYHSAFAKTNPWQNAGHYTLRFPAGNPGALEPGGDGFGTLSVDALGNIRFAGVLGDGTVVSQAATVSERGLWPFFSSLYSGSGAVLGWLAFTNAAAPAQNPTGKLSWLKTPQAADAFYPVGFALEQEAEGSTYTVTNGQPPLNFDCGVIRLGGGDLDTPITNTVSLGAGSKVAGRSANPLKLSFTSASGLFRGSVLDPATGSMIPFTGALLQSENAGYGLFVGTNETGRVCFGPCR